MNASVKKWGTWILSTIFFTWVVLACVATTPVLAFVMLGSTASPPETLVLRLLVACGVLWVLLPSIAYSALHLWQKTRFSWLALVPALLALVPIWFVGVFSFGWFGRIS